MPLSYNFPFICVFLCMVSAILLSVVKGAKLSYYVTLAVALICTALSAVFLFDIVPADEAFAFTMGKFPPPSAMRLPAAPCRP